MWKANRKIILITWNCYTEFKNYSFVENGARHSLAEIR